MVSLGISLGSGMGLFQGLYSFEIGIKFANLSDNFSKVIYCLSF